MKTNFLDAWKASGPSKIRQNFTTFQGMVKQSRDLVKAKRFEEAAAQATYAAYYAQRCHCGLFVSPELEEVLASIGREVFTGEKVQRKISSGIKRVLHIGTNMSVISGNPRLIRRWIQQDSTRCSDLVLTKQAPDPLPESVRSAVLAGHGRIHLLNRGSGGFISWARKLRRLAADVDLIIHHCWEIDVVPSIAFADSENLPQIIYVNHGDHWFWLGSSFSDAVVNLRESGMRHARNRRYTEASRCLLLPTPLEPAQRQFSRAEAKHRIGLDEESVMLLSIAGAAKYKTVDGVNFAQAHLPVLKSCKKAVLIVVGPLGKEDWSEAIHEAEGRIRVLPQTEDTALYYQAADIYVDSFPFTSITSLLEAGSFAVPLVSRFPFGDQSEILGSDAPGLKGTLIRSRTLDEYTTELTHLVMDEMKRVSLGELTKEVIEINHWGIGWQQNLEDVYAQILKLKKREPQERHVKDQVFDCEPDIFLPFIHEHTWHPEWIRRFVIRSMPFSVRMEFWNSLRKIHGHRSTSSWLLPEWLYVRCSHFLDSLAKA